jgi:hypothetical protein
MGLKYSYDPQGFKVMCMSKWRLNSVSSPTMQGLDSMLSPGHNGSCASQTQMQLSLIVCQVSGTLGLMQAKPKCLLGLVL